MLGFGTASLISSSVNLVKTLPHKPAQSPSRGDTTSPAQIEVLWGTLDGPNNNGGSEILSYNLRWDSGSGVEVDLVGYSTPYLHNYLTVTSGVTAGGLYVFRYRAKNMYGWGPFSEPVTLKAARQPEQITPPPVTVIENSYVKITWDYPEDNADSVVEYEILLRGGDYAKFFLETTFCDGKNPAVVLMRYCHVPMTTLRAEPFNLKFQDYIVVKVRARNALGWSVYSELNDLETQVQVEPSQMGPVSRGSLTSTTQI